MTRVSESDPYHQDERSFRTDARGACHWCRLRPQAWVWGPYGTRVCDHCSEMIAEGRAQEVVEEAAARITVRDGWHSLDPEQWRDREHALMTRWLRVRTTREPITGD